MEKTKEFKRYTLFFNEPQPLTTERMMEFINPLMKHGLFPQVNKGVEIRVEENGDTVKSEDIWSIDFFSQSSNGISVSVTKDRVDIRNESEDEWSSFKASALPLIQIVSNLATHGFSRLAIGDVKTFKSSKDEAHKGAWLSDEEYEKEDLREKMDQKVSNLFLMNSENVQILSYNYVTKKSISIKDSFCELSEELDINTIPGTESQLITDNLDLFFEKIVSEITISAMNNE